MSSLLGVWPMTVLMCSTCQWWMTTVTSLRSLQLAHWSTCWWSIRLFLWMLSNRSKPSSTFLAATLMLRHACGYSGCWNCPLARRYSPKSSKPMPSFLPPNRADSFSSSSSPRRSMLARLKALRRFSSFSPPLIFSSLMGRMLAWRRCALRRVHGCYPRKIAPPIFCCIISAVWRRLRAKNSRLLSPPRLVLSRCQSPRNGSV